MQFSFRFSATRLAVLLAATAFVVSAPQAARAQSWNFAADWSNTNNPNGVWSYGYRNTIASTSLTLMPLRGNFGGIDFQYASPANTGLPSIGKNNTASTLGTPELALPAGQGMLHPGNTTAIANLLTVVRWTAPLAGTYSINAQFIGIDTRGLNVLSGVVVNGNSVFSSAVVGVGGTSAYTTALTLTQGATVDFIVANNGSVGDRNWTQLNASIASAPEPGSLALAVFPLMGVIGLRIRRKK